MQNQITLGDILNGHGGSYIGRNRISGQEKGLLHLLPACRTAALGSHYEKCDNPHCSFYALNQEKSVDKLLIY